MPSGNAGGHHGREWGGGEDVNHTTLLLSTCSGAFVVGPGQGERACRAASSCCILLFSHPSVSFPQHLVSHAATFKYVWHSSFELNLVSWWLVQPMVCCRLEASFPLAAVRQSEKRQKAAKVKPRRFFDK